MKFFFSKLISIESILAQVYVLILIGMTLPYGLPIFLPLVVLYFLIYFIRGAIQGDLSLNTNLGFILFFFCVFAYLAGMVSNDGILYKENVRDIKNIISLLVLSFFLGKMDPLGYLKFNDLYSRLAVIALAITALVSLNNFLGALTGSKLGIIAFYRGKEFFGSSLSGSYNMFALGMFAGLFAACHLFEKSHRTMTKMVYLSCIALFVLVIVLAGSRRAWIVLALFGFYICGKVFFNLSKWIVSYIKNARLNTAKAIFAFILLTITGTLIYGIVHERIEVKRMVEIRKLTRRFDTVFSDRDRLADAFSQRTMRWKYATEILQRYSLKDLIFGSGFTYLKDYGLEFHSETGEDDPHNIFISPFLYSGILGGVLFIGLIIFSSVRVFNYRKLFGEYFILLFIAVVIFVTPGANSLFSVRILPIIMLTIISVSASISIAHDANS